MAKVESRMQDVLVRAVARPSGTSASEMVAGLLDALADHAEEVVDYLVERGALRQVPLEATGTRMPILFEVV